VPNQQSFVTEPSLVSGICASGVTLVEMWWARLVRYHYRLRYSHGLDETMAH
jgi:hypothetical protein